MKQTKLLDDTLRRMIRQMRPIAGWLVLAAVLNILAVLATVIAPEILGELVQRLYDFALGDQAAAIGNAMLPGLGLLLLTYGAGGLFGYLNMQLMNRTVTRHFTCGLRIKISEKLKRLPVKYVDQTPVGDILSRMIGDVSEMGGYVHQIFDTVVKGFFQIILIAVAMFMENWVLACFVILMAPLSLWLSTGISKLSEKHWDKRFEKSGKLSEIVEECFTNYATAKAYNLESHTAQLHQKVNEELKEATVKASFYSAIVQPIIAFTNAVAYILINLIGGILIVRQGVSVGTVVTIVLYARQFASPLEQISMGIADVNRVKASAKRVYTLLDMEEEYPGNGEISEIKGSVTFENVDFSYKPEEPLLENLNMSVQPGQKVAIVGPTGAGKTTIVNLLMRFYDVDSGRILLDGTDISEASRESIRNSFGMVLQDTWLFRGTIAENLAYGKADATRAEIEDACEKAYCDRFIRTMPEGYDTVIGEDTTNLSGGQKQLLTIARALLADRPLLILDEATSNVDTRTEILIQKAMDRLMKDKTCFVIAHRLSTIVDADVILVLDHGKILEQGRHQELLDKKGFYYQLYQSQYAV